MSMHTKPLAKLIGAGGALALYMAAPAFADVKIGITISTTGPAAALGIPEKNMIELWPKEIGGEKLNVIVLDDAGDPTQATTNARRLITDDKVDIIMGSSTTPPTSAVAGVALEAGVPHFGLGPVGLPPERMKVTFIMPQDVKLMAAALFKHMKTNKITTVGMIGFSDSWGDLWIAQFKALAEPMGLKLTSDERYGRADTSVTGQALKLVAAKPDAILVAASGTGAALPQIALRERGFSGLIYQTHGAVTYDFIRIAGKSAEGVIMASGPAGVADLLPADHPTKAAGVAFINAYEGKYGKDSRNQFAAHANDAQLILQRVIPVALKSAKSGTPEFRTAILKALETEKEIVAAHGVYNFTPTDHSGLDERGAVVITVKDGRFEMLK